MGNKKTMEKEGIAQKALERKRFNQEHEAINLILDVLGPLEVDSRIRVLRSAAHFLGDHSVRY